MSHDSEPGFQPEWTTTGPSSLLEEEPFDWDLYTSIHDGGNDSMSENMGAFIGSNDITPPFDPFESTAPDP
jgi:hypothetical protein